VARQPDTPPPPAAVQKIRLRYAKRSRLRFSSHRDFQRALERALRRCEVPMAYSAGFSPHPKISYAGAAPTGAASEAEYVEISVTRECDPAAVAHALDSALPPGLDIVDAVEATAPGAVTQWLTGSIWEIVLPDASPRQADDAVAELLAASHVEVERMTKKGIRRFDVRAAVVGLRVLKEERAEGQLGQVAQDAGRQCAILRLVVRHVTPTVRPDDVLAALGVVAGIAFSQAVPTRLTQGLLDEETRSVADPFTADRDVIGA
jgi:radical SAM-linked protein